MKPFIPSRLAEIIFALVIGYFGYLHFKNVNTMSGGVPAYFPGDGKMWIYITGSGFLLAAIAIIINTSKTLACYLLAAMLFVFIFTVNLKPALEGNPMSLGMLLKDTGLAMCAILIGNRGKR
jgi:putative oxidoreductase